jgi:hypothetical protein
VQNASTLINLCCIILGAPPRFVIPGFAFGRSEEGMFGIILGGWKLAHPLVAGRAYICAVFYLA